MTSPHSAGAHELATPEMVERAERCEQVERFGVDRAKEQRERIRRHQPQRDRRPLVADLVARERVADRPARRRTPPARPASRRRHTPSSGCRAAARRPASPSDTPEKRRCSAAPRRRPRGCSGSRSRRSGDTSPRPTAAADSSARCRSRATAACPAGSRSSHRQKPGQEDRGTRSREYRCGRSQRHRSPSTAAPAPPRARRPDDRGRADGGRRRPRSASNSGRESDVSAKRQSPKRRRNPPVAETVSADEDQRDRHPVGCARPSRKDDLRRPLPPRSRSTDRGTRRRRPSGAAMRGLRQRALNGPEQPGQRDRERGRHAR